MFFNLGLLLINHIIFLFFCLFFLLFFPNIVKWHITSCFVLYQTTLHIIHHYFEILYNIFYFSLFPLF
jgi:hypothetical protein